MSATIAAGLDDSVDYFMSQMDALKAHSCLPKEKTAASKQTDQEIISPSAGPSMQAPVGATLTGDRPFCIETRKLNQPMPESAAVQQAQLQAAGSQTSPSLRNGWDSTSTLEQGWNTQPA